MSLGNNDRSLAMPTPERLGWAKPKICHLYDNAQGAVVKKI